MNPIPFTNTYARLPEAFFAPQAPAIPASPTLIKLNISLAEELNLNLPAIHALGPAQIFSGATIPPGAEPIALAYAGHQFGHFVPQLGDGRAILLGEVIDTHGNRRDIQLKGSGRTPFSRGGDGRAALGPVLREYLVSEAMHALGIPTTRALAAVSTGEFVARERPLPGAVITRVAASHIRVGTFQFFAARGDTDALRQLTSHAIARHYPDAKTPLEFLKHVINAQAELIAKWMGVGFIHGVMNTDNMAISGETIDFGPCAFMDAYDPATVFSAIDEQGRYAYARQPRIAQWNLARLAETLVPLIDSDTDKAIELATEAINGFGEAFDAAWLSVMRAKLGLHTAEAGDSALAGALLQLMHRQHTDFTQTFRTLPEGAAHLFANPQEFTAWQSDWHARLSHEARTPEDAAPSMRAVNPAFIPRNHRVEQALTAAIENADFAPFEELLSVLMHPYDDQAEFSRYATPALPEERVLRTFCGT